MTAVFRSIRRRFSPSRALQDPVASSIENIYYNEIMVSVHQALKNAEKRRVWRETYVADPTAKLRALIRKGEIVLIRGLPRTGKTNLALVVWEAAASDKRFTNPVLIHNNGGIQAGHFFSNWDDFERLTGTFEPGGKFVPGELQQAGHDLIVLIFDDISKLFKARRAGAKRTDRLRDMFVECGKKKILGVAIEHSEKTADIDFARFSVWVLDKPYSEQVGKDAEVSVADKRKVDASRNHVLMWWTAGVPAAQTKYDADIPGEWQDTAKEAPKQRVPIPPPTINGYTVRKLSTDPRPDLMERLFAKLTQYASPDAIMFFAEWLSGEIQRAIGERHQLSQSVVSDRLIEVRENGLGYAFQDAWADAYPTQRVTRGNSPDPDAVDEVSRTVYSLKCFCDPKLNVAKAVQGISQSEHALHQQGYTLRLVIFECFTQTLYTYEVM